MPLILPTLMIKLEMMRRIAYLNSKINNINDKVRVKAGPGPSITYKTVLI